jgi:hypothetical protein
MGLKRISNDSSDGTEAVPPIKAIIGENARGYPPHEPKLVTALLAVQHSHTQ